MLDDPHVKKLRLFKNEPELRLLKDNEDAFKELKKKKLLHLNDEDHY